MLLFVHLQPMLVRKSNRADLAENFALLPAQNVGVAGSGLTVDIEWTEDAN
jgi:hypothetical protein